MKIALFQMNPEWQAPIENLAKIEGVLEIYSKQIDVMVLPEMFNTGYTMTPETYAESLNGFSIKKLTYLAKKHNLTFCGSIPIAENQLYRNDFIVINGEGFQFQYSKIHLFGPAGESDHYVPGNKILDFSIQNMKLRPIICYDLRFPNISFNTTNYDILICVANWPVSRIEHWKCLLKARAIENQCFVIGVNRVGQDALGYHYPGSSMVFDYYGNTILDLGESECVESFEPDLKAMYQYREKFPFIKDAVSIDISTTK